MRARTRALGVVALALLTLGAALGLGGCSRQEPDLIVWHAYRGAEAEALRNVVAGFRAEHPEVVVELISIPAAAYSSKLASAVPRGNGPDLFIAAQEQVGAWAEAGIVAPLDGDEGAAFPPPELVAAIDPDFWAATRYEGHVYGVPIATKTAALLYNRELLGALGATPPADTDALIALAERFNDPDQQRYGLVYEASSWYFHSAWLYGFGGGLIDDADEPDLQLPGNAESLAFARELVEERGIVPRDAQYNTVKDRFITGNALFAINGPWFVGELGDTPFGVVPIPDVSASGQPARPFVTVESVFVTPRLPDAPAERDANARAFMAYLAGPAAAVERATTGHQVVTHRAAYDDPRVGGDETLLAFAAAAERGVPMPNRPEMRAIWEPGNRALEQVLRGSATPTVALAEAQRDLERSLEPPPPPASPTVYLVLVGLVLLVASALFVRRARRDRLAATVWRSRHAYLYVLPAFLAAGLLIFVPFFVGAALSLYAHENGELTFVGFANFLRILSTSDYGITHPQSFFFTLGVTVLWTLLNVVLHVAIGLSMALLLREPWVKLRGVYRVLLIIPWAVPNYITALIWRSVFDFNFGAVNALLDALGIARVDWFSQFATAFSANLVTNTWLGFPFMMVVCLGALQSIPSDLEAAAEVDGANRWQRFRHIVLPLLKPALVPAVVLGMVWTFNMFNIIYLVSGGDPDGSTDILITEAYRWAFQRGERYGYAAAYGLLIFGVLLFYTWVTTRRSVQEAARG